MTPAVGAGPADRSSPPRRAGVGGRHRLGGAAGGHTSERFRTAAVTAVFARSAQQAAAHRASAAEHVIAPLCIVAAGAAFAAQVIAGGDAATFAALAVIPVLVASLLRSRALTVMVVAFAMLLQVWGVGLGAVSRGAAAKQITVYLLALAIVALRPLRVRQAGDTAHPAAMPDELPRPTPTPMPVIGVAAPSAQVDHHSLPDVLAQALTRREREVVVLATEGFTAREIGALLFIGERTVETHLANAYGKLGVRSRLELARLVVVAAEQPSDLRTGTEAGKRVSA